jgi:hypothetical protein
MYFSKRLFVNSLPFILNAAINSEYVSASIHAHISAALHSSARIANLRMKNENSIFK